MKIGLISDTHNDVEMTKKAIEIFKSHDVKMIIHSGDLTSPKMLHLFVGIECKFVLGNVDLDIELINNEARGLGFGTVERTCDLKIDNKRILVIHGNDVSIFRKAVASGEYDYIIKGHTHFFENYVSNNARIINPGSLYGSDEHTIVILNTANEMVKKIEVDRLL